jgi:hypothetical protein
VRFSFHHYSPCPAVRAILLPIAELGRLSLSRG